MWRWAAVTEALQCVILCSTKLRSFPLPRLARAQSLVGFDYSVICGAVALKTLVIHENVLVRRGCEARFLVLVAVREGSRYRVPAIDVVRSTCAQVPGRQDAPQWFGRSSLARVRLPQPRVHSQQRWSSAGALWIVCEASRSPAEAWRMRLIRTNSKLRVRGEIMGSIMIRTD
jgi:hypothetical protein